MDGASNTKNVADELDVRLLAALHADGLTQREIGKMMLVSGATVGRHLRAAGYATRTKKEAASGRFNASWRGGRTITKDGYVKIWLAPNEYILEHRQVMQRHLGRNLHEWEVIHHINGNPQDNRIENLLLCIARTHRREHKLKQWSRDFPGCLRCGTQIRKHAGKGLCTRCNQYDRIVKARGYECEYDDAGRRIFSKEHRKRLSVAARRRSYATKTKTR